jgi:hypothetical protein
VGCSAVASRCVAGLRCCCCASPPPDYRCIRCNTPPGLWAANPPPTLCLVARPSPIGRRPDVGAEDGNGIFRGMRGGGAMTTPKEDPRPQPASNRRYFLAWPRRPAGGFRRVALVGRPAVLVWSSFFFARSSFARQAWAVRLPGTTTRGAPAVVRPRQGFSVLCKGD